MLPNEYITNVVFIHLQDKNKEQKKPHQSRGHLDASICIGLTAWVDIYAVLNYVRGTNDHVAVIVRNSDLQAFTRKLRIVAPHHWSRKIKSKHLSHSKIAQITN